MKVYRNPHPQSGNNPVLGGGATPNMYLYIQSVNLEVQPLFLYRLVCEPPWCKNRFIIIQKEPPFFMVDFQGTNAQKYIFIYILPYKSKNPSQNEVSPSFLLR